MSDKKIFKFKGGIATKNSDVKLNLDVEETIESRGYKKAVKSFQNKHPKLTQAIVEWVKNGVDVYKIQKLPMGRKKKLEGY